MINVGLDAVGTLSHNTASGVTYTGITIGASGVNRALGIAIGWLTDPGAISIARWDNGGTNQNLVELASISHPTLNWFSKVYGVIAPTTGNKTLQITWTNSVEYAVNALSFVNVDQTGGATSCCSRRPRKDSGFPDTSESPRRALLPTFDLTRRDPRRALRSHHARLRDVFADATALRRRFQRHRRDDQEER